MSDPPSSTWRVCWGALRQRLRQPLSKWLLVCGPQRDPRMRFQVVLYPRLQLGSCRLRALAVLARGWARVHLALGAARQQQRKLMDLPVTSPSPTPTPVFPR